jgi:endogenous inhibitor of DNA gyrase (YacG/DUF329 family)
MPAIPSLGLNRFGSVRSTARPTTTVTPATLTPTKTPYWAGTEDSDETQATQPPARHVIHRKPVGVSAEATTTSPPSHSIPRKPVAASPEPVLVYTPVQGDPYRTDSVHQWAPASLKPVAQGGVQQQEIPLSPGSIFANGRPQSAATTKSKTASKLSRGFGSIRKVAGKAKVAAAATAISDEPKISTPVAGSFHRGDRSGLGPMNTPLHLVGIEVAQADPPRYGKPDYQLNGAAPIPDHQAEALARLTGEQVPKHAAAVPRADDLAWLMDEPAPTQPSVKPVAPQAPAAPAAPHLKRQASRKVVNNDDRATLFGDIIAAAQDSSWVTEPETQARGQAQGEPKDKGRASGPRAPPVLPASFNSAPSKGNPFAAGRHPSAASRSLNATRQAANADKSLPSSPAPGSMRRQTPAYHAAYASQDEAERYSTSSLKEALETEGARRASFVPGIKCADCGKMIDAVQVSNHRCGQRAAQAVDHESWASGPSREDKYAANYVISSSERWTPASAWGRDCMDTFSGMPGDDSCLDDPPVVVDTFVRNSHTSWNGVVHAGEGSTQSLTGRIGGGTEGFRKSNAADAANDWPNRRSDMSWSLNNQ